VAQKVRKRIEEHEKNERASTEVGSRRVKSGG
jgi:hypothetical protein